MRDQREDFWRYGAPVLAMVMAAVYPGCSCGSDTNPTSSSTTTTTTTTTTTSSGGGMGGMGGVGGAGGMGGGGPSANISVVANLLSFDATPNVEANTIYFTGISTNGLIGVFKKTADGSGDIAAVAVGNPFVAPLGIASGPEGQKLYVADLGVENAMTGSVGQIFSVATNDGSVSYLVGSEGARARGVEVYRDAGGVDHLIFSGVDPSDGQPGVLELPTNGSMTGPTVIAKGSPFADPSGVAISSTGDIYVCDTVSKADKTGTIFSIIEGVVDEFFGGLHIGYPCGIALGRDESALYVLALDPMTSTDQVLKIDLKTKATTAIKTNIDTYNEPGGLHRAKNANVFAFVDGKAQGTGSVFILNDQ